MRNVESTTPAAMLHADDLRQLLQPTEPPCISIYVPTTPFPPEADQNRIRYKNQLKTISRDLGLQQEIHAAESELLEPLRQLADDIGYWGSQQLGFVAFRSPTQLWIRRLLQPVPEIAVVAKSFHVKPLLRIVQDAARYQVLCLSNERVALYEGHGEVVGEVPLHQDVPTNMADAIGEPSHVVKTKTAMQDPQSHDERDDQLTRYFRRLDEAIWKRHSEQSNLPLILAALPEYHGFFHQASHNPMLLEQGIKRDPFHDLEQRELGKLAWEVFRPQQHDHLAQIAEYYGAARAHGKASDRIHELAHMAAFGRLETLLLQQDRHVGGSIDRGTGQVTFKAIHDPNVDDVLDDLAELTLSQGGEVWVVPKEEVPGDTGVAGIQRY